MKRKIAVIHTSPVSLGELKGLFAELLPEVEMINLIDDSLLEEVKESGAITPHICSRICTYARIAQELGAEIILNQCSSVGEACDIARNVVNIPYVKIDEAMAEKAVELGARIAVVGTVSSTMGPSTRLVERAARRLGKEVTVTPYLVDGALDILMKEKDQKKHNRLVLAEIKKAAAQSDVVVLAQGSMTVMLPYLGEVDKPVLTGPRLGVEQLRPLLDSLRKG